MEKILFSKLDPTQKQLYNKKMVDILSYFVNICEENHLRYSLAYGSILGAIRHKGIIPWDYDIDVFMPRPDYIRFLEVFKKEGNTDFQLLIPEETDFYPEPMAKIGDTNSSLLYSQLYPVDYGVFIDVFPLDGTAETEPQRIKDINCFYFYLRLFRICQSNNSFAFMWKLFLHGRRVYCILKCLFTPAKKQWKSILLHKMYKISSQYEYDKSEYVTLYREDSNEHAWFPRKWIDETIKVSFEGLEVKIPKYYHEYLTFYYGDYMQFPPEDQRDAHHKIDYLNIEKREPMKDILDKLK